jgi:drug/metabolite transporter (DMT)-like permease
MKWFRHISGNNLFLYTLTVLIWGSTWLFINFQLGKVPAEVSVVYRYAIASLVLFTWCWARGISLHFKLRSHFLFMLLGTLLFGINYIGSYNAQKFIPSALNAVVFSIMMWMNIVNTRLFFGTRIEPGVWQGALLGMTGIVVLFWPSLASLGAGGAMLTGVGLSLTGALAASLGNMVSLRAQRDSLPIIQSNAWGMLYGTIFTAVYAWNMDLVFIFDWSFAYVGSLLYLAIFGSVIAFGCYLKLVGTIGPHKAVYSVIMFPVVAIFLSVMFEGLEINIELIAGVVLVLAGNLLILGGRRRSPKRKKSMRFKLRRNGQDGQFTARQPDSLCSDAGPVSEKT